MPLSAKDCRGLREALKGKATNYRFNEIDRLLERAGFHLVNSQGSHRYYSMPGGRRLMMKEKGSGEILPCYTKLAFRSILESGGCDEHPG